MRKLLSIMALAFLVFVMPVVLAEEASIGGEVEVGVEPDGTCIPPEINIDHTARGWYPNDQTFYTADFESRYGNNEGGYGVFDDGGKYGCYGYDRYDAPLKQNYLFTSETLDYYVLVEDGNGVDDISTVQLTVDGVPVGVCAPVNLSDNNVCQNNGVNEAAFGIDSFNGTNMETYICRVIVQSQWTDETFIGFKATDGDEPNTLCQPATVTSQETDLINFNPELALTLTGGAINFGTVEPGSTTFSNTVYLGNDAEDGSGVLMDMYIASDDYFTDPSNPLALCGAGNGIPYTAFSYYATKGSINSGTNGDSDSWYGLGDGNWNEACSANEDEFTELPSYSGDIQDMCRIINNADANTGSYQGDVAASATAGLLSQGAEMSLTFKLDVPTPCIGSFTDGSFRFVGRVV